jgi:hypothetical protein
MPSGVYVRTDWHRKICSENGKKTKSIWKGKKLSLEHRMKLSKSHQGQKWTTNQKEIMSAKFKGKNNPAWKGGQIISRGYVYIYNPKHPSATKDGYVKRARLIMEKQIGRYLHRWEVIHHINGIKNDDRPENLMRFDNHSEHLKFEKRSK